MKTPTYSLLLLLSIFLFSCSDIDKEEAARERMKQENRLIVVCDYALQEPVSKMTRQFHINHPEQNIEVQVKGSRRMAQQIALGSLKADVFISSDYRVIENLLIPWYTQWYYVFAGDEMVIAYRPDSRLADEINSENWYKILLNDSVSFGRTDPDHAPVGYRAAICIKLSENYYGEEGIKDHLLFKDKEHIEAEEKQVFEHLKKGDVDYIFTYKSEALQQKLKFVELPEQINLKSPKWDSYYSREKVKVDAVTPGEYLERKGRAIRYAICKLSVGAQDSLADIYLEYFARPDGGLKAVQDASIPLIEQAYVAPDSAAVEVKKMMGVSFSENPKDSL